MKRFFTLLAVLLLSASFSGCDLWMDGEYYSVTPHKDNYASVGNSDAEVSSYTELLEKLNQMVSNGTENGVIYFPGVDKTILDGYMNNAIDSVMHSSPIGAYAVNSIEFESGTKTGKQAVAVTVNYRHGRSEILRIRKTDSMQGARVVIGSALKNCDAGVTIQVKEYEELDVLQYVQDFVNENPDSCMEMPQVTAAVYPEQGTTRILEILFTYQTSRDDLRKMQQTVEPIFDSAELYVSGDGEAREKYFQLYSFLMERHNYELETSITPAYHLLRHGVGDCKAFATVYAAMCRRAGLYCQVVTGTRAGESWYWNVIMDGDEFFYVDLLACNEAGRFTAKNQDQMSGYVWDYDRFRPENQSETEP
jgi:hypothetical protein